MDIYISPQGGASNVSSDKQGQLSSSAFEAGNNAPAAFMSYARRDDDLDDGFLSKLRQRLSAQVQAQTGNEFSIFQDLDTKWGQNWESQIDRALDSAIFLIPIITPSFLASKQCRREVLRFIDRETQLGVDDLILPIYYRPVNISKGASGHLKDPVVAKLAGQLSKSQFMDFRELYGMPINRVKVKRKIFEMARHIASRLDEMVVSYPASARALPAPSPDAPVNVSGQDGIDGLPIPDNVERSQVVGRGLHVVRPQENVGEEWFELADELENLKFYPADQSFVALRTIKVRALLDQSFTTFPAEPKMMAYTVDSFRRAIDAALNPGIGSAEVKSACESADRLRIMLIRYIAGT